MMQMKKQVMSQQQHVLQTTQIVKTEQLQSQKKVELGVDVTFLLDVSGSMAGLPAKTMASELEWFVCEAKMLQPKDTVEVLAFNNAVPDADSNMGARPFSKAPEGSQHRWGREWGHSPLGCH